MFKGNHKFNQGLLAIITLALLHFTLATTIHDAEHQLHAEVADCPVDLHTNGSGEQRLINLSDFVLAAQGYNPVIALPLTTLLYTFKFSSHAPRAPPVQ